VSIPSRSTKLSRRDFLKLSGLVAAFGFSIFTLAPQAGFPSVLPPGAIVPADRFSALCNRCGKCAAICHRRAVRQDNAGLPYIDGLGGWCDFCMDCVEVCPTGALMPADPKQIKLGLAVIDEDRCIAWKSIGCRLCYEKCLDLKEAISLDADYRPHIDASLCNGCGACVNVCPQSGKLGSSKKYGRAVALKAVQHAPRT